MPWETAGESIIERVVEAATWDNSSIDGRRLLINAGFNEETINGLWDDLVSRFETSYTTYSRWVDGNLNLLSAITEQRGEWIEQWILDASAADSATVSAALEAFITQHAPEWISTDVVAEAASWAVDAIQTRATEAFEAGTQRTVNGFFTGIDNSFRNLFPESMRSFFSDFSLWTIIKNFLIAIIPASWAARLFGEQAEWSDPNNGPNPEVNPNPTWNGDTTPPEVQPESPEAAAAWPAEWSDILDVETERFLYYKSWATLIFSLNGTRENTNTSPNDILLWLEDIPFSQIAGLDATQKAELLWESTEAREEGLLNEILEALNSDTTETLLRVWLSPTSIQNIIAPNGEMNEWLFEYFGETAEAGRARLEEILQLSQSPSFDWRQLTFWEISKLYISSIPALRVPAINALGDTFSEVRSFFGDGIVAENYPESMYIIPRHILEGFWRWMAWDILTNRYIQADNQTVIDLVLGDSPNTEDLEIMNRIFSMKDYLLGDFLESPRLGLSEEQKTLFRANLDYAGVLSLYSILWGINDINTINTISLPILLFAVSKVIWSGNGTESFQGSLYLWNYIREAFLSWDTQGLSEDEMAVLQIYGRRILDIVFLSHLDGVYQTMWVSTWITWLNLTELWLAWFAGWLASNQIGKWMIARWIQNNRISIGWSILRRAWLMGMLAGAVTWGAGLLLENNVNVAFSRDIEDAMERNDVNRFFEILERHRESIQEYDTPNGERLVISTYPWETPFVVYNSKIYTLNIGSANIWDSFMENWNRIWENRDFSGIPWFIAWLAGAESTGTIEWVNFEVQRYENGRIIFWEGNNTYEIELSTILELQNSEPGVIWNDIINRFTEWEYTVPWIWSEWERWYVINSVWPNHVLFLMEVWNIWEASI